MRILVFSFLLTLFTPQCAAKKNSSVHNNSNITFVYKHYTRGYYREYHFTQNTIKTFTEYNTPNFEEKNTIPMDWAKCLSLLEPIDLNTITALNSPSTLRHTDQAHHAEIRVIINDITYRSKDFDHENPPLELKPLVDYLIYMVNPIH